MDPRHVPEIASEVAGLVRIAVLEAAPVGVRPSGGPLVDALGRLGAELMARFAGKPPSEIPGLEYARTLYKTFGVDPTRTRPSSEALVRRAVQGKELPRVSNAVDFCNLCSLQFLLPIGLYDTAKIRGRVVLRVGKPGESYPGIRKDDVGLEGRLLLSDEHGPFGNPSSDSLRTCVDAATLSLLMVIFAPHGYSAEALRENAAVAAELAEEHLRPEGAAVKTATAVLP